MYEEWSNIKNRVLSRKPLTCRMYVIEAGGARPRRSEWGPFPSWFAFDVKLQVLGEDSQQTDPKVDVTPN